MGNMLIRLLPRRRFPLLLRYGAASLIVGAAAIMRLALDVPLQNYPLLLFFPAVFLTALLFDRGSGFYATALSVAIVSYEFIDPRGSFLIGWVQVLPLAIFVGIGLSMAAVIEALRETVEQLSQAQEAKSLLFEELSHRIKNDLAIISSSLSLQARASQDPAVREALEAAIARVSVVARAQERLRGNDGGGRVDLPDYLAGLCAGIADLLRDVRPIAVRVRCDPLAVTTSQAVTIGLIVNELVTNALKHAFPGETGGTVSVDVAAAGGTQGATVRVRDDGVGCPAGATSGLGSRLVRLLTQQLGGSVSWASDGPGYEVVATLLFEENA